MNVIRSGMAPCKVAPFYQRENSEKPYTPSTALTIKKQDICRNLFGTSDSTIDALLLEEQQRKTEQFFKRYEVIEPNNISLNENIRSITQTPKLIEEELREHKQLLKNNKKYCDKTTAQQQKIEQKQFMPPKICAKNIKKIQKQKAEQIKVTEYFGKCKKMHSKPNITNQTILAIQNENATTKIVEEKQRKFDEENQDNSIVLLKTKKQSMGVPKQLIESNAELLQPLEKSVPDELEIDVAKRTNVIDC